MESAKYYRLDQLPEPDFFELELEKIYQPPPTPFQRVKQWVRRYWILVGLFVLVLVAAVSYAGIQLRSRPRLIGILGPDSAPLKELAGVPGAAQVPATATATATVTVTVENATTVSTDGNTVTVDVAGVDVKTGNETTTTGAEDHGETILNLSDTNATTSDADNILAEGAAANATSGKPVAEQDDGQVSIHDAPQPPAPPPQPQPPNNNNNNNEPLLPISATFYSGVEGPKACRGHVIAVINLPKAQTQGQDPAAAAAAAVPAAPTAPQCYNFPGLQASGCANFVANKADGCAAQVFAETNCRVFMNTAAFMAETRPVGGNWRSVRVQCGIPEPDPATLGKPPMMDAITSMKDNDKAKGGA